MTSGGSSRRRRLAAISVAVIAGGLLAWAAGRTSDGSQVSLRWEGEPVDFTILALNPLDRSFAVVDFSDHTMRLYPYRPGLPPSLWGAVEVAAFTRRGDILIYPSGTTPAYLVPGGDFDATPLTVTPSKQVPWEDSKGKDALGDRSGENVWLLQRTDSERTLVDLVRVEDDTVLSTVELEGSYWIAGLAEDDLYVAGSGGGDDVAISQSGRVREVTSCLDYSTEYGHLSTVGVFANTFACVTEDEKLLVIHNEGNGRTDVVAAPEPGAWTGVFLPNIPAVNTTGHHNDQVLLLLQGPDAANPSNRVPEAVYVADLSHHTVRLVHEYDEVRHEMALGVVDGRLIVEALIAGDTSIVAIDVESGERQTVIDLPEGYFVYDAG